MKIVITSIALLFCYFSYSQFPGCPDVNAGADQNLSCSTPCATLTATPFQAGATTSYSVSSIPHTPPIAYNAAGGTGVSVGTDDVWSPQITLPFNFCYYGQTYTNCKIGSNGAIKFNSGSGGSQAWSFTASCPSTSLSSVGDIFGIYHDIDPSVNGTVKYYLTGTAPCRILCVVYNDLAHYSCTSMRSTFMMVLYETTNVIDVYVQRKDLCTSWNSGNAIIGIQNPAGTAGIAAPGRNTTPTWQVSTPEAWRFTPNGAPIYTVEWFQGATSLGTNTTINVCPTVPTTYTAQATYTACDGTVIVKTDDVLVTPNPGMPTLAIVSTTDVSCSSQGSATVQGSGGSGSGYQYSIDNGATWQASGTFSNLAAGTYNILTQDGAGCQGGMAVTINPPAGLQPVNAGPDQTVCQGFAVTLTATGSQTYSWNNGVTQGTPFVPTSTQSYIVTGTDNNGCIDKDTVLVTVNPLPNVQAGADQNICQGTTVTLSGTGAATYTWDNGVTNGVAFTPSATTTYTVTGTDAAGCQATAQVTVNVSPAPNLQSGSDQTVCAGDAIILNATGATTITWSNGVTNGVSFVPSTTTTYTVTGSNGVGCDATAQVTVTVNPLPVVSAGSDLVICAGDAIILSGSGAMTYTWSGGVSNGVSFVPTSTQTYTVTGTNAAGCQSSDQVNVTVNPLPIVNAGVDQSACQGQNITLSATGSQNYVWNNGVVDGTPFIPGSTQTFTVTGTDANGCQNSDQVTVTVVPFPNADISSDVVEGYPTLTVNFTNNSTNATSYQWNFGNGSTNTASNTAGQQAQYPNPGDYVVILTASNGGCTDKDTINIHVFQFLEPTFVLPNIITPNGDNNNDFFFINVTNVKNVKVTIVNRWGNKVAQYEGVNGFWDGTINGSPAVEGDYFVNYEIVDLYDNSIKGQGFVQVIK